MRLLGMAVGIAIALAAPVNALSVPSEGKLTFDVMRKGKDIGDHSYSFSRGNGALTVTVATDIAVKVPLIRTTAYSFTHISVETWIGGTLQHLSSTTNDDGAPHSLNSGNKGAMPASLWNDDIVRSGTLMNTIDGKIMSVRIADLGSDSVKTKRGTVGAHHYRMSGDLARDLWYDADRAIALQKPWMRVLRNSLLQPAFLNFPRFDPFAELALIMFKAMRLKAAKLAGA